MAPSTVVLYVRQGCHLCEDAHALLIRHGLHPLVIDIDVDQTKKEAYDECVPVVEIDGTARFRGRINEPLLRRIVRRYKRM